MKRQHCRTGPPGLLLCWLLLLLLLLTTHLLGLGGAETGGHSLAGGEVGSERKGEEEEEGERLKRQEVRSERRERERRGSEELEGTHSDSDYRNRPERSLKDVEEKGVQPCKDLQVSSSNCVCLSAFCQVVCYSLLSCLLYLLLLFCFFPSNG